MSASTDYGRQYYGPTRRQDPGGRPEPAAARGDFALVRYNADGTLDTTFDSALTNTLDGNPTFTEGGAAVVLDADVQVFDEELSGIDNFSGATLTLARNLGANSDDAFSATGTLGALTQGGNLVVGATTIGTVTTNSGGTLVLTFNSNATNALVNSAMQQIAYSNSSDTPEASVQIDWTFNDGNTGAQGSGGALEATGSTTVNISAVNDLPIADLNGADGGGIDYSTSFAEGDSPVNVTDSDATISDIDNATYNGLGINLGGFADGASELIRINGVQFQYGVTITQTTTVGSTLFEMDFDGSGFTITKSGGGAIPQADLQALLLTVTYENTSDDPTVGNRTLTIIPEDAGLANASPAAISTISVTAVNDDPVLTLPAGTTAYTEGAYQRITPSATLTDIDSADFDGGQLTVTISSGGEATDDLYIFTTANILASGVNLSYDFGSGMVLIGSISGGNGVGDPLILNFNANATAAAIQDVIENIYFRAVTDDPSTSSRTIDFQITDGDSGTSTVQSRTIDITAVNDAPVTSITASSPTFTENAGQVGLFSGASVDVVEAGDLVSQIVITVDGLANGSDEKLIVDGHVIELTDLNSETTATNSYDVDVTVTGASATVTISKAAGFTEAAAESLLNTLAYNNTSEAVADGVRVVTYISITDDGGGTDTTNSGIASLVTVNAENDAPEMDPNGTMTLTTITEDDITNSGDLVSAIIASGGGDRITDPDAGALEGIAIFNLVSSNGTWQYNTGSGWTDVDTVDVNNSLLLRATDSLRFVPDGLNADTAFVTFAAWDQTSGTAGAKVDTSAYGGTTAFSDQVETAAISITAVNDEQSLDTNLGLTLNEGSTATIDNALLSTSDVDNTSAQLVYSVTSVPTNGQLELTTGPGVAINSFTQDDIDNNRVVFVHNGSETTSDSFSFTVDDGAGSSSSGTFNITITPVNDNATTAISDTDVATEVVLENASLGTTIGVTAFASDADAGDTVTYSLDDNDGGRFTIDSNTGIVTVAGAIDRETDGASRSITVRATSTDTSFQTRVFSITVNDVDEFDVGAVTDVDGASNEVDENAVVGTVVGITAAASDADATTNTITYSLQDNDGGRFSIDSSTGIVTVAGAIDREVDGPSRNITVRATSADGSFTDQIFAINIKDVDEFDVGIVTDTDGATNEVDENAVVGTTVGITALASDADATNNTITYTLDDNAGGRFAIDGSTGVVTVADGTLLDREAAASHNITVRATSSDGSFNTAGMTINLNDVDEFDVGAVTDSNAAANAVDENAANGTVVGVTALASDADATNNTITYTLGRQCRRKIRHQCVDGRGDRRRRHAARSRSSSQP